jgi:UDP-2,3-diacylglucosamine hydrolase
MLEQSDPNDRSPGTIGLIAGWGRFPVLVAESLKNHGYRVACVAIREHASQELEHICDDVRWMGVAKLGGHVRYFQKQKANRITMAGKLFKANLLFQGWHWARHLPDLTCIRALLPHLVTGRRDSRDDSLLTTIVQAFLNGGIDVVPATDFAPELLVQPGILTQRKPSAMEARDGEFGWQIAKQMGALDIGQSITVRDQTILAVEAVEGTDQCIERTGQLCRRGGFTLVKVAKPQQDMRFDVPTVGPLTIQKLAEAGGTSIVIEANRTIIVDLDEVIKAANRAGIAMIARHDDASAVLLRPDAA